jgi:hypothetical protein
MFGMEDPGIWMAYLLAFACLIFALWYGLSRWNREEDTDGD